MQLLRTAGLSGMSCGGWARRATALTAAALAGGGVLAALAASPAAAATPVPQPGVTPSAARAGSTVYVAYTGTDQHVYLRDVTRPAQPAVGLGGRLNGGPGLATAPPSLLGTGERLTVFGRGTDNALWWRYQTASGWSSWQSLGGVLTSQPAAIGLGPGPFGSLAVFVRGTDGKVWYRTLGTRGWSGWALLGGRLLPGTGPAAGGFGILLLTVAGTDRHVWTFSQTDGTRYGFADFGGRTAASPAPAAITIPVFVVFARGTDNALWYRQGHLPLAPEGPWRSLGGRLTSGVTATSEDRGKTYVFALGTDNHIWMRSGFFPALDPWTRL